MVAMPTSLKYYPARVFAAVTVLVNTVIGSLTFALDWSGEAVLQLNLVAAAVLGLASVVFVESRAVSRAGLEDLAAAEEVLDKDA
jgi:hypothetical protein